jgi:hypothetical protein
MHSCLRARGYITCRTAEGKTVREIRRSVKHYITVALPAADSRPRGLG